MAASVMASFHMLSIVDVSRESEGCRRLNATNRCSWVSQASYTVLMPPVPICSRIS